MSRQYASSLRAEQSSRTRRAIVDAAIELFLEHGYAETSVRSVAAAAGVSERTVYVHFSDKASILTAIGDHLYFGGDEDGEGWAEFATALAAIPALEDRLRMTVHQSAVGLESGLAALAKVVAAAAHSDPRLQKWIADMVEVRHRDMRAEVEAVLGQELPDGDTYERMIDELEAVTSEELYWILAVERRWSRDEYERYVVDLCLHAMASRGLT